MVRLLKKMLGRIKEIFVISILLSATITGFFLISNIDLGVFTYFRQVKLEYIFSAILVQSFVWFLLGLRTKILSNTLSGHISLLDGITTSLSSLFVASTTPGSGGGEPLRVLLLNQKGLTLGKSTALVVVECFLDLIFFVIMLPIGLFLLKGRLPENVVVISSVAISILFILGLTFIIGSMFKPDKIKNILCRFFKNNEKIKNKIEQEIDYFNNGLWHFANGKKMGVGLSILCTILLRTAEFVLPVIILMGLGLKIRNIWVLCIAVQAILVILMFIPLTPGGSGIVEISMFSLYATFIASPIVAVFIAIYRVVTYYLTLLAGGITSIHVFKQYGRTLNIAVNTFNNRQRL